MESGQVFLPPEELAVLRAERAHAVIKVHDEMHERVHPRVEGAQSAGRDFNSPPPGVRHDGVVNNVESRHLIPLLFQDEKVLKRKI